jgi:integrase
MASSGKRIAQVAKKVTSRACESMPQTVSGIIKDAGGPDSFVMALVGHESAAMSHRYTHVGKEALARAAKTLPEI